MTPFDVLIVGAGPAGLSAAADLRAVGASVIVAEREQEPGGIPRHTEHLGYGMRDLHRVLQAKMGIPLTLALVYIFAGQRAGLEVYGLNTPGHYLAGIGGVVFDPFHGGVVLSADDLAAKFGTERSCWASPMFMRATPRDTAERMLVNLLNSYSRRGDEARHARTVSYLQMLEESLG